MLWKHYESTVKFLHFPQGCHQHFPLEIPQLRPNDIRIWQRLLWFFREFSIDFSINGELKRTHCYTGSLCIGDSVQLKHGMSTTCGWSLHGTTRKIWAGWWFCGGNPTPVAMVSSCFKGEKRHPNSTSSTKIAQEHHLPNPICEVPCSV